MQRLKDLRLYKRLAAMATRHPTLLWGAALVLIVTIVYWPTLENGFVSDDWEYIDGNLALRSLSGLRNIWFKLGTTEQYYPLVHSTFWVEYHLWGT